MINGSDHNDDNDYDNDIDNDNDDNDDNDVTSGCPRNRPRGSRSRRDCERNLQGKGFPWLFSGG